MLAIPVAAGVLLVLALGFGGGDERRADVTVVFHVTLADPDLYVDGVYADSFQVDPGEYQLRFVPNGDSPPNLSIGIEGPSVSFAGEYTLHGTLHDTGISEYYTWEYAGPDRVVVPDGQSVTITVDPQGDTAGPVSVSLIGLSP